MDGGKLMVKKIGIGLIIVLVAIQLIPVDRNNPEFDKDFALDIEGDIRGILERSCFDCHSHETKWPWYSYIAPAKFLVSHDVHEAREHLNFSTWYDMDVSERMHVKKEIWKEVEGGNMPLPAYLILHSEAELSDAQKEIIKKWTELPEED